MENTLKSDLQLLYSELGSEERVFDLVHGFYETMAQDPMIGFFFANRDLTAISRKQAEFMLRAMGVRSIYTGKSPAQAHSHLPPILPGFFDRRAVLLRDFLRSKKISDKGVQAWIAFEEQFRNAVITPKK
ncbi:hypothetical protein EBZ37_00960 [bacterium]|nr:hypothetical protein [bacterium]